MAKDNNYNADYNKGGYRNTQRIAAYNIKNDCTLDDFFDRQMSGKSKAARKRLLSHGCIRVGDRVLRRLDDIILAGSTLTIEQKPEPQFIMPAGLQIVYEDDWLIVVNKASGLLTIATETEKEHTAYAYLSAYLKFYNRSSKIFIVHRIDRFTSGLLIFAKSEMIQHALRDNWDDVVLSRRYVAIVEGHLERAQGTITTWINENPKNYQMYVCRPGMGKKAVTHYKLLDQRTDMSLIELNLETGRKNQIRVHMGYIGHKIVGDRRYGSLYDPIGRLCLHAMQIEFIHPMTGHVLNFETRIPPEFLSLFKKGKEENKQESKEESQQQEGA